MSTTTADVTHRLDDHAAGVRRGALESLARGAAGPLPAAGENVNMHAHSFFSFNAEGWSPSRVAWECRRAGLYAAALCDFDVLDGVEEFLEAGLVLGLRTAAHLETRVFLAAMRGDEITSPGEPGVTYIMGAGFVRLPASGSAAARGLAGYRQGAAARNAALVERVNGHLPDIALDYARDVEAHTPSGNPTERHLIRAYIRAAQARLGDSARVAAWWGKVLGPEAATPAVMADAPRFEELVRAKLVKRGGLGYAQPSEATFPRAEDFAAWVRDCGALPMITWLDGTSAGERDAEALLECMCALGCVALNIVPDRNWNVKDAGDRARKVANLGAIVAACERRGLPINIGTEMNRLGLPFVDDLDGAALRPHKAAFIHGARVMVGHSVLARYADFGFLSAAAVAEFPKPAARNTWFAAVGALPPLMADEGRRLANQGPVAALATFRNRVRAAQPIG